MQDSLPAGWLAFAGRELNPLDRYERFPSCYISSPFPEFILTLGSGEFAASNIQSLVQRVAGTSLQEIDNLIGELQNPRDYIATEGERVQREITGYARLNHAALTSTRIISDSMSKWKDALDEAKSA